MNENLPTGAPPRQLPGAQPALQGNETDGGMIALRALGSFHVGGNIRHLQGLPATRLVPVPGAPPIDIDPNGAYSVGPMYVQYAKVAVPCSPWPLLLWHGGGMTGACWETTPDGRPGWQSFFLRAGLDVYVSDAVERGRSGFARWPQFFGSEPFFMPQHAAWENYRIGPAGDFSTVPDHRRAYEGSRFPVDAFDSFTRQMVPRWQGNEPLIQDAYDALLQRMNCAIVLAHSQGAGFALQSAMRAPERVAALVLVEPGGLSGVDPAGFASCCGFPLLVVWGDRVAEVPFWAVARQAADALVAAVTAAGGDASTLDLPAAGVPGNSHLPMMDRNSDDVAQRVLDWLMLKNLCSLTRI